MNVCMDIFAPEFRLTFCYIYLTILFNVKVVSLVDKIIEYESYDFCRIIECTRFDEIITI